MWIDKLTSKLQIAFKDAQELAVVRRNAAIEPLHLMKSLLKQDGSTARYLLVQANVNVAKLQAEIEKELDRLPTVEGATTQVGFSNQLDKLMIDAAELDHRYRTSLKRGKQNTTQAVTDSGSKTSLKRFDQKTPVFVR